MKALVTGAAGMIGSHLVDSLIEKGYQVYAIDDLSRGKKDYVNQAAEFTKVDIADRNKLFRKFSDKGDIDVIIHQASIINEGIDVEKIDVDIDVNIRGTINLLDLANKTNVKRFVYASSVAVYGRQKVLPAIENSTIPLPIASYGICKLASELYIIRHCAEHENMSYACLRYSNVYGPRQGLLGEVGVISYFSENILNGDVISVHGSGKQTRDFLYVDDCVEATLLAAQSKNSFVVNIGSGYPTSVNEVVAAFEKVVADFNIRHVEDRHGEIGNFYSSIDKASMLLNWKPKVSLIDGVRKTIEYKRAASK